MIDIQQLEFYLHEAAMTERRLRDPNKSLLKGLPKWPHILHDAEDRKNWIEETKVTYPVTSRDITILETANEWLRMIKHKNQNRAIVGRKIIWARAYGFSWRSIAAKACVSHATCCGWYKKDTATLCSAINSTQYHWLKEVYA